MKNYVSQGWAIRSIEMFRLGVDLGRFNFRFEENCKNKSHLTISMMDWPSIF